MINHINNSKYCDPISPVSEGTTRPLWSVIIPTFNCASYLRETLASVLAQDPGPEVMQIEVVDDHSTKDDPEAVVRQLAGDRVSFYRQAENVGHVKNFTTCLQRSRGKLIHLLHGDDCVREGFYLKMQQAFDTQPEIGAAFCRHIFMDETGHWRHFSDILQPQSGVIDNWLEKIIVKQYIQTPSIVVRRQVYEKLGSFDRRFRFYYEDWEMWVRIAAQYPVWYEVEPLAIYRLHSVSNTGQTVRTGKNMQEVHCGLEIVQSYLPAYLPQSTVDRLIYANKKHSAICALRTAQNMLMIGDIPAAIAQIKEAFKCSISPKVMAYFIYFATQAVLKRSLSFYRS
ncbi:Glycosyltransferase, catalytic subunit of cellulose synthase and poly-beta-1,6-N-acetylglucosamine synthase [Nostoc flagelliforme CCNUN1]|uniref:Glycosyltransferase, catalytic subunit of cellulose synthase and poly-beta-1,6-N-acetylglucosamine synthase n=1 Tax=Nostoc flagelliforme CCNUN1 TaxID=2038116 RepID=A0A2K8SQX7_9NOSO|nr:glycosyltransferase [Nostoc flagelliforme]AUB37821.1 Glycosyltransferase, catalytic subunit of cellulose synthase and poly-beta-1,6-N-acetylglucosamine synthase [Nostoc flagelliforme CCNUN1]